MRNFIITILAVLTCVGCTYHKPTHFVGNVQTIDSEQFICKVKLDDQVSIRLLILKHAPDEIANLDGDFAVVAANVGSTKGLSIEEIGNFHINKQGRTNESLVYSKVFNDLEGLKQFIKEQAKVGAKDDDTLMVYTIGHGGGDGSLMRLGQRAGLMRILAEVSEENQQRIFWWQLSCHAAASLPSVNTLTEEQKPLFSMTASSPANEVSYFNTQSQLMEKMFVALAEKNKSIDPDQDGNVDAGELKDFMIKNYGQKRGSLMYAADPKQIVFGLNGSLANKIPIIDRNNTQKDYPKYYIPFPNKR
jgi:hypothetical protein